MLRFSEITFDYEFTQGWNLPKIQNLLNKVSVHVSRYASNLTLHVAIENVNRDSLCLNNLYNTEYCI